VRYKFIIKPPLTQELKRKILELKKKNEVDFELTEKGEESPKSAKNLAKRAIKEGFERIIVCGGDGLLNEAINGIMTEKIPENFAIGVIPTGSGNNFAKALGIPKDIKKAFEIIKTEKKILVDVGKVNQKFFINCFSLGFDAKINELANKIKENYSFLPRSLSYLFAALKEIIFQIPSYEMETTGEINFKEKLVLVAITNSPAYGGIFKINPGASISDGKFNLCKISPVSKLKAIYTLFLATQGKHLKIPEVKTYTFSEALKISSKEPIIWEIDGEVQKPEKEFKVKILKNSLAFFCLK
jgi:YegS/Rv2252/BmrU family lipid kinase